MSQQSRVMTGALPPIIRGVRRTPFRDLYHRFLRASWPVALAALVALFMAMNAVYAGIYLAVGGIANARPGSFADAFFFSVQTMGTIGYGSMYPATPAANVAVVSEAVVGILVIALTTGLLFSKFSVSNARFSFSRQVVIGPWDGVPTLMLRLGNDRGNQIVAASVNVILTLTERSKEGVTFYRMLDLPLSRDRFPVLSRSWTVMHRITPDSLLHGHTPESLHAIEAELLVTVTGTDDTSLQPVHGQHTYLDHEIVWGARHADVLSEQEDGRLVLDVTKFHDVVSTEPAADFPYPRPGDERRGAG